MSLPFFNILQLKRCNQECAYTAVTVLHFFSYEYTLKLEYTEIKQLITADQIHTHGEAIKIITVIRAMNLVSSCVR